jgi:hypothetical protein
MAPGRVTDNRATKPERRMAQPDLPTDGNPKSSREKRDRHGNVIQRRFYGGNGRAIKNIDYDHDHGAGQPHAHDWDWTQEPPRQPGRPLQPGE